MFGSRHRAGVDLGEHSLRYALTDRSRTTVSALWSATLPTRESRGEPLDEETLRPLMREAGAVLQRQVSPFVREVRAVIQGADTVCGYVELPPLKGAELATAVQVAAARKFLWPLEEVFLTHVPVRPIDPTSEKAAAFFVAVRLDAIERRRRLLEEAGLVPTGFDVPAVALAREAAINHDLPAEEFVGLVHSGFGITQVAVIRGGQPYYFRDFPLAGADFTYGAQMGAQSTWAEAEQYKRTYDAGSRVPAMEAFVSRWLDDVKRSLERFETLAARRPARVLLSGGTARMPGLAARLQEHLGLPTLLDEWSRVRVDKGRVDPSAAAPDFKLAVGAALQE